MQFVQDRLEIELQGFLILAHIIGGKGEKISQLAVKDLFCATDVPNPDQQLIKIFCALRIADFEAGIVQKNTFFQKLPQVFRSPLPELETPRWERTRYPMARATSRR
jgi:hypothetical protein